MKSIRPITPSPRESGRPVILFITYTMGDPRVGGAFFRALRLATEFHRRGWEPIICNSGPELDDPKVWQAQERMRFIRLVANAPGFDSRAACRLFESLNPEVLVFGETPFEAMRVFYEGAKMARSPLVVFDQYYGPRLLSRNRDADLVLLYGLQSFWPGVLDLPKHHLMVPPFIEHVTPTAQLPIPEHLYGLPWVTLIAYDEQVLEEGIALLASLRHMQAAIITVSRDPDTACRRLAAAGIGPERAVHLPIQNDANMFGFMSASRAVIVSNGFLQVMDALALASPVICISRRNAGITRLNIDQRFKPFVSIEESFDQQRERLIDWLTSSPFPPALSSALQYERQGVRRCADLIAGLAQRHWTIPRVRREVHRFLSARRLSSWV